MKNNYIQEMSRFFWTKSANFQNFPQAGRKNVLCHYRVTPKPSVGRIRTVDCLVGVAASRRLAVQRETNVFIITYEKSS